MREWRGDMSSIAWGPILTLLAMATVVDIHSRRIPNWLVPPFLAAGVMVNTAAYGVRSLGRSMGGIAGGVVLDHPSARTMPYAPAIAIGTIFSIFAV